MIIFPKPRLLSKLSRNQNRWREKRNPSKKKKKNTPPRNLIVIRVEDIKPTNNVKWKKEGIKLSGRAAFVQTKQNKTKSIPSCFLFIHLFLKKVRDDETTGVLIAGEALTHQDKWGKGEIEPTNPCWVDQGLSEWEIEEVRHYCSCSRHRSRNLAAHVMRVEEQVRDKTDWQSLELLEVCVIPNRMLLIPIDASQSVHQIHSSRVRFQGFQSILKQNRKWIDPIVGVPYLG